MMKGMRSNADGVLEAKRRSQKWKRLAGVLGCLVVFVTAYVLMRPAETLERELICGMEEHQHSVELGCYQEAAAESVQPICGLEETGHAHSEDCYSEESVLTCTEPEGDAHQHDENCYTAERVLTCGLEEAEGHTHTAECYPAGDVEAEPELTLVCELPEHTHTEDCYADDAAQHAQVEEVAALIDALPSAEEVEARLTELLAAEDTEAYDAYCAELARQVEQANAAYEALSDEQKAQLNIDRLTALFVYLPAKEQLFTLTAPATESGIVVTISGEASSLPFPAEELTLTAAEVEDENANALRDEALESAALTAAENYMLDIRLMHGDEEVQPTGPIKVTFAGLPLDEGADAALVDDIDDSGDDDAALVNDVDDSGDDDVAAYQAQEMAAQAVMADAADEMDISDEAVGDTEVDADESSVTGPKVYQIDEETRQATEVDVAVNEENNVVLETNQLTDLYSVSLLAANGNVMTADTLKAACEAGGTVVLGGDISTSTTITISRGKNTTLDLNGYKITFTNATKNAALFHVTGGLLTIVDSTANADGTSKEEIKTKCSEITYAEGDPRKSLASISNDKLTYYVVESVETDITKHLTTETQWTHTVPLGNGQAGAIVGSETDGQTAILCSSEGAVNMNAGYICGFGSVERPDSITSTYDDYYSAVTILSAGTFNLSGGVLAANRSYAHGGAIYMYGQDCKLVMTGGIISGNYADREGGGIYCSSDSSDSGAPSITVSGNSYITCNTVNGYYDGKVSMGGGGVHCRYRTSFTMYGGYITGNYSKTGGGGVKVSRLAEREQGDGSTINMYGGYISANKCLKFQGGGISCNFSSQCNVQSKEGSKIFLTNNQMLSEGMFGGGAIYIGHASALNIYDALISENRAKHISGGFSGCNTSYTFFFLDHSVAIFDNYDGGANGQPRYNDRYYFDYVGSTSNPYPYPLIKAVDGRQDVYVAGKARIYAGMLGGGDPKWSGCRDGSRFAQTKSGQYFSSHIVLGLTAHPSDADKNSAREAANVYITGNYSARYAGGIMSNGTVYFGHRPEEETLPTEITLIGKKSFLQKDGITAAAIADGRFTITVTNTEDASEVYTGTVDSSGNITFPTMLFQAQGTKTYKIKEVVNPVENITYDTTTYTMTVTLAERQVITNRQMIPTLEYYFPTTVEIVNDKTNETVYSYRQVYENFTIFLRSTRLGTTPAFTNQIKDEEYSVNVTKVDSGDQNHTLAGAEFKLEVKNGDAYAPVSGVASGTTGVYTYAAAGTSGAVTTFVTAENGNLQIVGLPAGDYKLTETKAPEGYLIATEWQTGREFTLSQTDAPTGAYTVTVADPSATYTFQFLKVSEADNSIPVPGATYQLLDSEGQPVTFIMDGTNYRYNASGTITDLVTGINGRFQLTGLPQGSYTLRETAVPAVPAGFGFAPDHAFTLSPETTENQVFTYTQEEPVAYELPETGGRGAKPYVITGAALLVGAACLMVCREARRKAGGRTS